MSRLNLPLLFTVLVLWLIGGTWWFYGHYNTLVTEGTTDCSFPFEVKDGNFKTSSDKTFFFEAADWQPIIPSQTLASLKSIALYLSTNQEKVLLLNSRYAASEVNNSDFPNNGIARAEAIKNELIDYGAPANQIKINAQAIDQISWTCGRIINSIDFSFKSDIKTIAKKENQEAKKKEELKPEPEAEAENNRAEPVAEPEAIFAKDYIIYYKNNESVPKVDKKLDTYFKQLNDYLSKHPRAKLLLTGHTDNRGVAEKNVRMGKYRARKLRDLIMTYGVAKRRIQTDSKGPKRPVSSNNTEAGRDKNRRVEIKIME